MQRLTLQPRSLRRPLLLCSSPGRRDLIRPAAQGGNGLPSVHGVRLARRKAQLHRHRQQHQQQQRERGRGREGSVKGRLQRSLQEDEEGEEDERKEGEGFAEEDWEEESGELGGATARSAAAVGFSQQTAGGQPSAGAAATTSQQSAVRSQERTAESVATGSAASPDGVAAASHALESAAAAVQDTVGGAGRALDSAAVAAQETASEVGRALEGAAAAAQETVEEARRALDEAAAAVKGALGAEGEAAEAAGRRAAEGGGTEGYFNGGGFLRGRRAMESFRIIQVDHGALFLLYDFYLHMLKQPAPTFALAVAAVPLLVSFLFALLFLPDLQGVVLTDAQIEYINRVVLTSTASADAVSAVSPVAAEVLGAFEDVSVISMADAGQALRKLEGSGLFGGTGGTAVWVFFQLFVYSLAISTGLEPPLSAVSPYALLLANVNALVAQLVLVFLSGAVFARLTQPSNPVRCSSVLLVTPVMHSSPPLATSGTGFATSAPLIVAKGAPEASSAVATDSTAASRATAPVKGPPSTQSRPGSQTEGGVLISSTGNKTSLSRSPSFWPSSSSPSSPSSPPPSTAPPPRLPRSPTLAFPPLPSSAGPGGYRMLVGRYVLSGPQPCELVDVKIELTLRHTTVAPTGSFFRAVENLELVRPEDSYQRHGMTVRHVIDARSPLHGKSRDELEAANAQFCLAVIGIERSSMQAVFHMSDYFVSDGEVVWNAVFEEMIRDDGAGGRVVDHNKISDWKFPDLCD